MILSLLLHMAGLLHNPMPQSK